MRFGARTHAWLLLLAAVGCSQEVASRSPEDAGPKDVGVVEQAASRASGNSMTLELDTALAADTTIFSASTTANYNAGGATGMSVGRSSLGNTELRSLLWFDMTQLPRSAGTTPRIRVDGATLRLDLMQAPTTTIPYSIANASRAWVEGSHLGEQTCTAGATWNRPNCAASTTWVGGDPSASIRTGSFDSGYDFESTSIPTSTILGYHTGTPYYGWVLRPTNASLYATASIITREGATDPDDAPELAIDYACLPGYQNDLAFGPGGCTGSRGSVCSDNGQCKSGACSSGVCRGDAGETCTASSQCLTNSCVSGRCVGFNARVPASKDTYVLNISPTANRGAGEELVAGRMPGPSTPVVLRTIVDFEPSIPAHAIIDSVQLRMTQVGATGTASVTAHLRTIPGAWVEGNGSAISTTCSNAGGATENRANCTASTAWTLGSPVATSVSSIALDSNRGQKVWSLPTNEIVSMQSVGHNGYLLDIGSPTVGTSRWFISGEGATKWGNTLPVLSVNYRCAPGWTAGGSQCLGEPATVCTTDAECGAGNCADGFCCLTACSDIECGNACGRTCNKPACPTGSACNGGQCVDHCFDGIHDGNETGLDCGGRCARSCMTNCTCSELSQCGNTDTCGGATCGSCNTNEICQVFELDYNRWGVCHDHCNDALINHGETGLNCGGGGCEPCVDCTCVGRACGAQDGCGNVCTTGTCTTVTEPASATLPALQDDTPRGAVQHSLGDIDTRWIGARGTTVGMLDDGPAVCGASDTGRDVYYHFRVCAGTDVRIYTTGAWTAHAIALFRGNRTTFSNPLECGIGRSLTEYLEPGDYYVLVKGTGSTTGSFNLYVQDQRNFQPTCSGGGVPGVCGTFDECADSLEERLPLERARNHLGVDDVATSYTSTQGGHEGKTPGLRTEPGNTSLRSTLFFDSFEFGQRWTVQSGAAGSVSLINNVGTADTFTRRPSSFGARIAGNVWMQVRVPLFNVHNLELRFNARAGGGLTATENLAVQWSVDGYQWNEVLAYRGTNMTLPQSVLFATEPSMESIYVRLRVNAGSTGRYVDVDNVELRARDSSAHGVDVSILPTATNRVDWNLCDDQGVEAPPQDHNAALSPPATNDFCPAIPGPCRCAEDPGTATAQDSCNSDTDCNRDQRCTKLAAVYCSRIPGETTCAADADGYLLKRYCTRPYASCGNQPALGCFSGTLPLTAADGTLYTACRNPAETPCKVINDCAAPDATRSVRTNSLPTPRAPASTSPAAPGLQARSTFDPLETRTEGVCSMEMAADTRDMIRHVVNPACSSGEGMLGAIPAPADVVKYNNCSNSVNPSPVSGVGDSKFDVEMAPDIYKITMFRDLPLGESQYMVDTGVRWEIRPTVWGNSFTLFGIDAGASLDRCEMSVRADVTLLDQDIDVSELANALTDSETFPLTTPEAAVTACRNVLGLPKSVADVREALAPLCAPSDVQCVTNAVQQSGVSLPGYFANQDSNGLIILANKAKKALTDARHVMSHWNQLPANRRLSSTTGSLCQYTKNYFAPAMYPAPGSYNPVHPGDPCDINIVNAWISEYRMAMTRLGGLGPTTPSRDAIAIGGEWDPNLRGGFSLIDEQERYDVLAISFAFPVGPLSALMEVSAGGTFGVGGRIDYATTPSALVLAPANGTTPTEIARASATLAPRVSAVVTVFVGAGIGNQFIGAHIGVQGDLELVALSLPMQGTAALTRTRTPDTRQLGAPWLDTQEGFDPSFSTATPYFPSQRYFSTYDSSWFLNGYVDLDLLDGTISLAARLRLLFYTLQFSKKIAEWNGFHERIDLIDLGEDPSVSNPTAEQPVALGTFAATNPFPVLSNYVAASGDQHTGVEETIAEQATRLRLPAYQLGWSQQCVMPVHRVD